MIGCTAAARRAEGTPASNGNEKRGRGGERIDERLDPAQRIPRLDRPSGPRTRKVLSPNHARQDERECARRAPRAARGRDAPSATRTPISRVRVATMKAMTP